jgi:hypothetical protein
MKEGTCDENELAMKEGKWKNVKKLVICGLVQFVFFL